MKRIIPVLLFLFASVSVFAQKRYVTLYAGVDWANLSGDVPASMKTYYYSYDFSYYKSTEWVGDLLNLLAKEGFVVEQMSVISPYVESPKSSNYMTVFLLSRPAEDSATKVISQQPKSTDNSDVHEVARYNLQGMPVKEGEKGIQIVVYSNYTTKTVINE